MNNTLKINKRKLYLCKRYLDNGIEKFREPKVININYQPANSGEQLNAFGINYTMYLIARTDLKTGQQFSAGDRCYIFRKPPAKHDALCEYADYAVNGNPASTLNVTEIQFKRLSTNVDN